MRLVVPIPPQEAEWPYFSCLARSERQKKGADYARPPQLARASSAACRTNENVTKISLGEDSQTRHNRVLSSLSKETEFFNTRKVTPSSTPLGAPKCFASYTNNLIVHIDNLIVHPDRPTHPYRVSRAVMFLNVPSGRLVKSLPSSILRLSRGYR